jgi:hypothetical protein
MDPQHVISVGLATAFLVAMFFPMRLFMESRSAKHLIQCINDAVLVEMSDQKSLSQI